MHMWSESENAVLQAILVAMTINAQHLNRVEKMQSHEMERMINKWREDGFIKVGPVKREFKDKE